MEIILKENVEKLGERGDVVEVADGYARNYLLPKQLAVQADKEQIQEIKMKQKQKQKEEQEKIEKAQQEAEKIEQEKFVFPMKAGEEGRLFGSITSQDIADKMEEKGFVVDRRNIDLDENIKSLGEHVVSVKLYQDVSAEINIEVVKTEEEEE
ncbi:MAG: 50S ribosomal protein L9 [Halanaerobiaceae bacterium]